MAIGSNWAEIWQPVWGPVWQGSAALVTVPDVVGETQAAGTTELETALFVVAVQTDYSNTVPAGTIISQVPTGGTDALEGSTVTITVSLGPNTNKGAGRPRRRYQVEIDGQIFDVDSPAHAQALLDQARELALRQAPKVAESVVQKRLYSKAPQGKPIRVPAPQVHTSHDELASIVIKARHEIAKVYRQAALDAEIRFRLQLELKRQQDESDEDDALLLL